MKHISLHVDEHQHALIRAFLKSHGYNSGYILRLFLNHMANQTKSKLKQQ